MSADFQTQAEEILESLGKILGFEDLDFYDDDDTCLLMLDGNREVAITLSEESNELILHHQIGILPETNRFDIVEQLLEANLFWAGTRGATLSMERVSGDVIIAKAIGLINADGTALTGEELGTAVVNLAEVATYWAKLFKGETPPPLVDDRRSDLMAGLLFA